MNVYDEAMQYLMSLKSGEHIPANNMTPIIPMELILCLDNLGYLKSEEVKSGEFRWVKQ